MLIRPAATSDPTALGIAAEPDATLASTNFGGVFDGAQREAVPVAESNRVTDSLESEPATDALASGYIAAPADLSKVGASAGANAASAASAASAANATHIANAVTEVTQDSSISPASPLAISSGDPAPAVEELASDAEHTGRERSATTSGRDLAPGADSLALPTSGTQPSVDPVGSTNTSVARPINQPPPDLQALSGDPASQQQLSDSTLAGNATGAAVDVAHDVATVGTADTAGTQHLARADVTEVAPIVGGRVDGGREGFLVRRQGEQRTLESVRSPDLPAQSLDASGSLRSGRLGSQHPLDTLGPIESAPIRQVSRVGLDGAVVGSIDSRAEHSSTVGLTPSPSSITSSPEASTLAATQPGRQPETAGLTSLTQDNRQLTASNQLAIERSIQVAISRGLDRASVELEPADLGRVDISIVRTGDDVQVSFKVSQPQARELIESSLARLRDSLDEAGLKLSESSVRDTASNSRDRSGGGSKSRSTQGDIDAPLETDPLLPDQQRLNAQALVDLRV